MKGLKETGYNRLLLLGAFGVIGYLIWRTATDETVPDTAAGSTGTPLSGLGLGAPRLGLAGPLRRVR